MRRFATSRPGGLIALLAVGLLLVGCGGTFTNPLGVGEPTPTIEGKTPAEWGRFGARLYNHPDRADAILQQENLTRPQFKRIIRRIATDPDWSKQYHEAFADAL